MPRTPRVRPRTRPRPVHAPEDAHPEPLAATGGLAADPIALPPVWVPPPRPPFPVLASVVPVAGAVGLWLVTGSVLSLWLALLGPVIAAATLADAARGASRGRRAAEREAARGRAVAARDIELRHRGERARLWARHPDVSSFLASDDEVWRAVPGRAGTIVVGAGAAVSDVRVVGGGDDPASAALRQRARLVDDAPVTVPLTTGIAVAGPEVLAEAAMRALVLQVCLSHPPGGLRLVAEGEATSWTADVPHARIPAEVTVAVVSGDGAVPPAADAVLTRLLPGASPPPACGAVLTVDRPGHGRLDHDGRVSEVAIEGVARGQAAAVVADLARRARTLGYRIDDEQPVHLADLLPSAPRDRSHGLTAVIGRHGDAPCAIDLVDDGPHAVVAGITGSGKSELLISWVLALCAGRSTRDLGLLLADFKGGTAFDGLADLPHVTGVITDLDGGGARRAIESLRAEVRWREGELARAGARDIRDARVELPRLVVVVDEFAALLAAHPELHAVFTDVAARGRALGMHLILGTQRVAGVLRESLLANVPLRISLRVTDAADSRAVIGTDEAAQLPGGRDGAGRALVRRAGDGMPRLARIALATAADIATVAGDAMGPRPRRPWLPDLPPVVALGDLEPAGAGLALGLIDEPEHQRQRPAVLDTSDQGLLVVGGAGSGRSTVLETIAAQCRGALVRIPPGGEEAWDVVARLAADPPGPGSVVLVDDLDALPAALPQEYAIVLLERLERLVRAAGASRVLIVASVRRLSGPAARVAELLPRRALLSLPSRAEHIAAGGDGAHHVADAPPGRGRLDGRAIQFAIVEAGPPATTAARRAAAGDAPWIPTGPTAMVARRSAALRGILATWSAQGLVAVTVEEAVHLGEEAVVAASVPHVVVGAFDEWQRRWALLARLRGDHDLLVDAGSAADYRILTGDRELPPYCAPGRLKGWLRTADGPVRRVVLPSRGPEPAAAS